MAQLLTQAVNKGLKGDTFKATDYRNTLKAHLEHNVFAFSAAKNFAAFEHYQKALVNEKGEPVSYGRFRDAVTEIDKEFNNNWLKSEYNSAMSMAQSADKWEKLQAFEYLEYRTVGDNKVRRTHEALDRKVFAKDDPLLDEIFPPNDWGCRCTMIPAAYGAKPDNPKVLAKATNEAAVKPYFKRNVGKSKMVFDNGHPVMKLLPFDKESQDYNLKAQQHYNLPSAKQILQQTDFPDAPKEITQEQVIKWFNDKAKNGVLPLKTKDNIQIELGSNFMDKLVTNPTKERSDRTSYAHVFKQVIEKPDEIWSHKHRGKMQQVYIKFYKGNPYTAIIKEKAGKMEFETFHKYSNPENKRVGVLKYSKQRSL